MTRCASGGQVCADAADEPLALAGVRVSPQGAQQLRACWAAVAAADAAAGRAPLYPDADGFSELVAQVARHACLVGVGLGLGTYTCRLHAS